MFVLVYSDWSNDRLKWHKAIFIFYIIRFLTDIVTKSAGISRKTEKRRGGGGGGNWPTESSFVIYLI